MPQIHQLIRSRRKSLALVVTEDAKLIIRAPHCLPERDIHIFIEQKRSWIERKLTEISARPKPPVMSEEEKINYCKLAQQRIPERVKYYSELAGLQPRSVRISKAKKRWGSCGSKGTLNFAWRLVLAPLEVIDYVVVHELVHLVERNHGRKFWKKVSEIIPGYKVYRKWLRKNGSLIG